MSAHAATLTEFLRKPKQVIRKVDKHDVILRRTGGKPSLRLSLESRAAATSGGNELAAHLLVDAMATLPGIPSGLAELLVRRFPWARFLPSDDRLAFAKEFIETLQACLSVGNASPLDQVLSDWKATAVIYADPTLAAELSRPLPGTNLRVPRPRARAQKG